MSVEIVSVEPWVSVTFRGASIVYRGAPDLATGYEDIHDHDIIVASFTRLDNDHVGILAVYNGDPSGDEDAPERIARRLEQLTGQSADDVERRLAS